MIYVEDIYTETTSENIGNLTMNMRTKSIPTIGDNLEIVIIGDISEKPHFHIIDHNNKIDYCIGIYDGKPVDIIINREYTQGILSNDQLKEIDKWKELQFMKNTVYTASNWQTLAECFDESNRNFETNYYSEYQNTHKLKDIPNYATN